MSLRWRLLLAFTLLIAATVAAVVITSRRIVRDEFLEFTTHTVAPPVNPREVADAVLREWSNLNVALPAIAERVASGRSILILNPQNELIASSSTSNIRAEVLPGGELRLTITRNGNQAVSLFKGASVPLHDSSGVFLGTLYLIPKTGTDPPVDFPQRVNRSLLLALMIVGVIAIALTAILSSRIARPLEQLTIAANRVAEGDLAQHVDVKTRDEVGELAGAFNVMSQRLAANETVRRNMVNDVAHELRTPLTNLRCAIESMQDGLRPISKAAIDSLHDDVMLLQHLVDDLQTLALAEAGKLPFHPEEVDVRAELDRVASTFNDARIRVDVDDEFRVRADRIRLQQIVSNLVRNALTHTPAEGSVVIAATQHSDQVHITVTDTGEGIAAEHLAHVFDRFYRADPSRRRSGGGAGLGLAIVKQLVALHGGTVAVTSDPHRSTTFTLHFPRVA